MSSKNNSDTDIDIESPLTDNQEEVEEPTTPVPTSTLSKETRKLRKKKLLDSDEDTTESYLAQVFSNSNILTDEQIDLLDTDDLMEHADAPVKKSLTNRRKKKSTDNKKSRSTRKLNIVKSDIIKKVIKKHNLNQRVTNPKKSILIKKSLSRMILWLSNNWLRTTQMNIGNLMQKQPIVT